MNLDHPTAPAGQMTVESLTAEIEDATESFRRLNDSRPPSVRRVESKGHVIEYLYATLPQPLDEELLGYLADRIDRLYKFRAHLIAKWHSETPPCPSS